MANSVSFIVNIGGKVYAGIRHKESDFWCPDIPKHCRIFAPELSPCNVEKWVRGDRMSPGIMENISQILTRLVGADSVGGTLSIYNENRGVCHLNMAPPNRKAMGLYGAGRFPIAEGQEDTEFVIRLGHEVFNIKTFNHYYSSSKGPQMPLITDKEFIELTGYVFLDKLRAQSPDGSFLHDQVDMSYTHDICSYLMNVTHLRYEISKYSLQNVMKCFSRELAAENVRPTLRDGTHVFDMFRIKNSSVALKDIYPCNFGNHRPHTRSVYTQFFRLIDGSTILENREIERSRVFDRLCQMFPADDLMEDMVYVWGYSFEKAHNELQIHHALKQ